MLPVGGVDDVDDAETMAQLNKAKKEEEAEDEEKSLAPQVLIDDEGQIIVNEDRY